MVPKAPVALTGCVPLLSTPYALRAVGALSTIVPRADSIAVLLCFFILILYVVDSPRAICVPWPDGQFTGHPGRGWSCSHVDSKTMLGLLRPWRPPRPPRLQT